MMQEKHDQQQVIVRPCKGQFGDYINESNRLDLVLDKDYIQINHFIEQRQIHLAWDDVVGSNFLEIDKQTTKKNDPPLRQQKAFFCIYAYPKKSEPLGVRSRLCFTFIVDQSDIAEENKEIARRWHHKVQHILQQRRLQQGLIPHAANLFDHINATQESQISFPFVKPFLIFINPKSGKGCSQRQFSEVVAPILNEAGLPYELIVTKFANYAKDYMQNVDLKRFSAFVILSGDGLIYEVINGLALRPDWEEAIKCPIGALPGGSGNGLSSTLCYEAGENLLNDLLISSTFLLTRSCIRPIDLVYLETKDQTFLSFLSFGYGMMSQIDIESETLRWLGNARFLVFCLVKALSPTMKTYRVRLSFLPTENQSDSKIRNMMNSCVEQNKVKEAAKDSRMNGNVQCEGDSRNGEVENSSGVVQVGRSTPFKDGEFHDFRCESTHSNEEQPKGCDVRKLCKQLVPLSKDVPSNWITLEDDFINIYSSYVSHLAVDNHYAPGARLDDGYIQLTFVTKGFSRLNMMNMLSQVSQGTHLENPDVYVARVLAFRLEPLDATKDRSIMTIDGESIPNTSIQAEVLPSLGRVLACSSTEATTVTS